MPTVLVTGASRGLGLELVRQYAVDGWDVIACARDPQRATALAGLAATRGGGHVEVEPLDLVDSGSIAALAARLGERPIDVLLNSAGTMGRGSFAAEGIAFGRFGSCDPDDWLEVYRVNVIAPMQLAETLVGNVARSAQRKIVSLTSVIGSIGGNTAGSLYKYRASKAALNAVMRSMAIDLAASHGIVAVPLHPGWTRTDMGGPRATLDVVTSVRGMRAVIAGLTPEKAGRFWAYDGSELPW
jgi:NAD(P)-dependent dehydrogenase (short-subunit alcohol dehydrogenase family)